MIFINFDVETTGSDPANHDMLSIGTGDMDTKAAKLTLGDEEELLRSDLDRQRLIRSDCNRRIDEIECKLVPFNEIARYAKVPWDQHDETSAKRMGFEALPNETVRASLLAAAPERLHEALRYGIEQRDASRVLATEED